MNRGPVEAETWDRRFPQRHQTGAEVHPVSHSVGTGKRGGVFSWANAA
jgi:hypothetical protein